MAKTFIGIDTDNQILRLVALEEAGKKMRISALVQRELAADEDPADAASVVLSEWDATGVRMAAAMPALKILGRKLEFPFGERRKVAAALPLELGAQVPLELDDHVITAWPPVEQGDTFQTIGVAVAKSDIASTLSSFNEQQLPLRFLGVEPLSFIGRFDEQTENCLLVNIRTDYISTLLVQQNHPVSYRTTIRKAGQQQAELIQTLSRDMMSLQRSAGLKEVPVLMFGAGLDADLQRALIEVFPTAKVPEATFEGNRLPAEFIPALALARCAAAPGQAINLRQGEFVFRGSLAPFRKQLLAAAVLLSVAIIAFVAGSWTSYSGKAAIAQSLKNQMDQVYVETFPGTGEPPKDIPLHMTSRLNAARNQSQLFGGAGAAPLAILEAITRAMPQEQTNIIRELSYDENGIRVSGQAATFDAIDRLAAGLKKQTLFNKVQISDAKTNIDGKRVDFRIDLGFSGQGGGKS